MTKLSGCAALCVCLVFACSFASAQAIAVYPDPAFFGTVDLNQTGYPLTFFVTNETAGSITVSGITITGTNNGDFAFESTPCVGTILGYQSCTMVMTFTPSAIGTRVADLQITVAGQGSPVIVPLDGTGGNPLPTVTSLSPPTAYEGAAGVKLTINGSGFLPTSSVYWENSPLPTTYVSATKLTAQVPAIDLASTGSDYINVSNPAPGGGSSSTVYFEVVTLDPIVQSASPSTLIAGTASTAVIVGGNNFMSGATVMWNGAALPTTFLSSSQLQAQISTADLAQPQIAQLAVSNPAPGNLSASITFNVTYPASVRVLDLPANNLVWDPFAQLIYASVPSSYGANGNSIATINPFTGAITGYHFAGSEPNQLALSSTSNYLYAGVNGDGSVQRFIIPGFKPDISVNLGQTNNTVNVANSLAVSPGDAHTFAVGTGSGCCTSPSLEFFTDTTKLAEEITNSAITDILFANSTTLYAYSNGLLSDVNVTSNGGTLGKQWSGFLEGSTIQYDAGLVYSNGGEVFNPATGDLVGTFDVGGSGCCFYNSLLPDAAINRAFSVGSTPFSNGFGITAYNLTDFTPVAVTNLDQFSSPYSLVTPSYVLWGSNGVAFILQAGCCGNLTSQVVLVQSATMFQTMPSNNKVPSVASLSPDSATHGGGNFVLTLKGANFFPGSTVTWNGKHLTSSYVNSTELTVYVPRSNLVTAGTAAIAVSNGSTKLSSAVANFTIK